MNDEKDEASGGPARAAANDKGRPRGRRGRDRTGRRRRRGIGRDAAGGAGGRARRAQGPAVARACRDREHPPPRPARTRGRDEICGRAVRQGPALGGRQSAPRARQLPEAEVDRRAHAQPARRRRGDRARTARASSSGTGCAASIRRASASTTISTRRSSRPSAPIRRPARSSRCLQPGYVLHDRLLRPAMVGVAKGGPAEAGPTASRTCNPGGSRL